MLLGEHPRREALGRVVLEDRDGRLGDDGSGIEFGNDEMHRRAVDLHAAREGPRMRVEAAICG